MAVLRPHLALTVTDVERSVPLYEALFAPEKVRPEIDATRCYARQDEIWVHDSEQRADCC